MNDEFSLPNGIKRAQFSCYRAFNLRPTMSHSYGWSLVVTSASLRLQKTYSHCKVCCLDSARNEQSQDECLVVLT